MTQELTKSIYDYINSYPAPHGWCLTEKANDLAELITRSKSHKVVVEIGVFGGRSLIPQAMALRENGAGKIYGIDPWRKDCAIEGNLRDEDKKWWGELDLEMIHRHCMENIWNLGLNDYATILRCASQECYELFPAIDILHIDGTHSEESSCRDVELYMPLVKDGGFLWFDDVLWPTTQKALEMIRSKMARIKSVQTEFSAYELFQKL